MNDGRSGQRISTALAVLDLPEATPGPVAIMAPHGSDAELLQLALDAAGIAHRSCAAAHELEAAVDAGAGGLLLTQEALNDATLELVTRRTQPQSSWWELPLMVLVDAENDRRVAEMLERHDITLLHRPIAPDGLISVVRLALDARRRQLTNRALLSDLESRIEQRTAALARYSERLEREIEERHRAEADLRRARQRIVEQREEERRRLGRDLHDDVVQRLLVLNMKLIDPQTYSGAPSLDGDDGATIGERERDAMRREVLSITGEIRRIIRQLRPAGLELGIVGAIEDLAAGTGEDYPDAPQIGVHTDLDRELSPDVALCVYRSAQELLRNAVRHAGAEHIEIRLAADARRTVLEVADDGVGFDVPDRLSAFAANEHFGLIGVAEHVDALGGSVSVEGSSGEGTTVTIELPA